MRPMLLALSLCLAGCSLAPKYERPEYPMPAEHRGMDESLKAIGSDEGAELADVAWWDVFTDATLQSLIRAGLEYNYDLRIATARVVEARAGLTIARSGLYPSIVANGKAVRTDMYQIGSTSLSQEGGWRIVRREDGFKLTRTPDGKDLEAGTETATATLDLAWEIDLWGRVRSASEAALADFLASEAGRAAVEQAVVTGIAEAYLNLCELDLELDIARKTMESRQKSLRLVQARKDRGVASRLEVRQAEVLVITAEGHIPAIESSIAFTESLLSILVGDNPRAIQRGRTLSEQDLRVDVPPGLPSSLLERRPDIIAAEQGLIAANARVGEARAAYFPRLALTGSAGVVSPALANVIEGPAGTTAIAPTATWTLFNAGKVRAGVRAAKAQRDQALLGYEQTVQLALKEVADALVSYSKTREIHDSQQKLVTSLDDATGLATKRYQGGVSSYLEVLDAERQLFDAQLALAQVQLAESLTVVRLYKSLGGGWEQPTAESDKASEAEVAESKPSM